MPAEVVAAPLEFVRTPAPSSLYLAAACRHYVIEAVRSAFEAHSGLEQLGQVTHRSMALPTDDGQLLLLDREGRLLGGLSVLTRPKIMANCPMELGERVSEHRVVQICAATSGQI